MSSPYEINPADLGSDLTLPDPASPSGEAMAWWLQRVRRHAYVGPRAELPSAAALRVLRDRELVVETPGGWAFVVRTPHADAATSIRRNAWALIRLVVDQYAPAALARMSAVRLAIGDESLAPTTHLSHRASESKRELTLMEGYKIILHPDPAAPPLDTNATAPDATIVTLSTTPSMQMPIIGAASLLTTLTLGDLRDNLDPITVWLRTLFLGRAALDRAYESNPRGLLLKRMGDLARDAGNARLANSIDQVVSAHSRAKISRSNTGVGHRYIVPTYVADRPAAATPWLERHRVRMARALETASSLLEQREATMERLDAKGILAVARAAKAEDTYHSTTIEGYRITREEVHAVIAGLAYHGRSAEEIERLMALKGYAQAFDWTLGRIREAKPPVAHPRISEAFVLDAFVELWGPSVDAGIVTTPELRDWRNHAVQINGSDHVPPAWEKLRGLMSQFVAQLNEADVGPLARAVVGHWAFVHLHPFKDGNGRVSRLLMNYLLSTAGLPWTTIRAEERTQYFAALERAHVHEDIAPFAEFIFAAVQRAYGAAQLSSGAD